VESNINLNWNKYSPDKLNGKSAIYFSTIMKYKCSP